MRRKIHISLHSSFGHGKNDIFYKDMHDYIAFSCQLLCLCKVISINCNAPGLVVVKTGHVAWIFKSAKPKVHCNCWTQRQMTDMSCATCHLTMTINYKNCLLLWWIPTQIIQSIPERVTFDCIYRWTIFDKNIAMFYL